MLILRKERSLPPRRPTSVFVTSAPRKDTGEQFIWSYRQTRSSTLGPSGEVKASSTRERLWTNYGNSVSRRNITYYFSGFHRTYCTSTLTRERK